MECASCEFQQKITNCENLNKLFFFRKDTATIKQLLYIGIIDMDITLTSFAPFRRSSRPLQIERYLVIFVGGQILIWNSRYNLYVKPIGLDEQPTFYLQVFSKWLWLSILGIFFTVTIGSFFASRKMVNIPQRLFYCYELLTNEGMDINNASKIYLDRFYIELTGILIKSIKVSIFFKER